ncbi:MAG TPA: kelch repeat-containing protein [Candidatus Limnocylindrales bacterium]|nr:kelch repeat-containing protein [Candidatus Limnocylindrales bacterium]
MTGSTDPLFDQRIADWLEDDPRHAPGQVLEIVLAALPSISRRRASRVPRWFTSGRASVRWSVAAAAIVGVLAVGGALSLLRPGQSVVGGPSPTPVPSAGPSEPGPTPTSRPSPTGLLGTGRQIHTATLLADGRVLVAGGFDNGDGNLASADLYDPRTDTFRPTGSLASARGLHTATLLSDGRVLIAGGGVGSWVAAGATYLASAELYDPNTGTFSPTGSMTTSREDHTATRLADGRVLIVGGNDAGSHAVASAELYDPKTGTFSPTGSMAMARGFHTATLLADGRVLIAGGDQAAWTDSGPFLASAEVYDPRTGSFTTTGTMPDGRAYHAATLLSDGRVLITGGVTFGGANPSLASVELYDPRTGKFSPTGAMTVGRVYQTATLLSDGRVLIAGGLAHGRVYANNPQFLDSAELYDPKVGKFSPTGSMTDARTYHGATLLADGRVLVTAGYGDVAPLASAEIYDPNTGTFSPAG